MQNNEKLLERCKKMRRLYTLLGIIITICIFTGCSKSDDTITNNIFENGQLRIKQNEFIELYESALSKVAENANLSGQYYLANAETSDELNCTTYDLYCDGNYIDINVILYDNRVDIRSSDFTDNNQYDVFDDFNLACIAAALAQGDYSFDDIASYVNECINEMYAFPYVNHKYFEYGGPVANYSMRTLDDISFLYERYVGEAAALGHKYQIVNIFSVGQYVPTDISKLAGDSSLGTLNSDGSVTFSEEGLSNFVEGYNYLEEDNVFSTDVTCTWKELSGHLVLTFEERGETLTLSLWPWTDESGLIRMQSELPNFWEINFRDYR